MVLDCRRLGASSDGQEAVDGGHRRRRDEGDPGDRERRRRLTHRAHTQEEAGTGGALRS